MPCQSPTISAPFSPPIIGDFGLAAGSIKIPFPGIDIPTDLLESLQDFVNNFQLIFPSSVFKPNIDEFTRTILDILSNLMSQIAPFLSFYNFIMALLKLITCIIEVLCALPNPFKIAAAVSKLMRECLPPFLAMFPFLALIAIIIALLLLIIALIIYIIATIIAFIEEIIRNLTILAEGLALQNAEAVLAATQKIANLMCLIENILAIFVALSAILAIIQALSLIGGAPICDDEEEDGCCSPDVCPSFIKDSPLTGTEGRLVYNKQIGVDLATALGLSEEIAAMFNLTPTRLERWQLVNTATTQTHTFSEIIIPAINTSVDPPEINTFWPEGMTYASDSPPSKVPVL